MGIQYRTPAINYKLTPPEVFSAWHEFAREDMAFHDYCLNLACAAAFEAGRVEGERDTWRGVSDVTSSSLQDAMRMLSTVSAERDMANIRIKQMENVDRELQSKITWLEKDQSTYDEKIKLAVARAVLEERMKNAELVRGWAMDRMRFALMGVGAFELELKRLAANIEKNE